jgi:hypothetical protein
MAGVSGELVYLGGRLYARDGRSVNVNAPTDPTDPGPVDPVPTGGPLVVFGVGQSIVEGAAVDAAASDANYPSNVRMWHNPTSTIVPITEPISTLRGGTPGMSVLNTFVKDLAAANPTRDIVVANFAWGGTGFTLPDSNVNQADPNSPVRTWNHLAPSTYTTSNGVVHVVDRLSHGAVARMKQVLAAVPGAQVAAVVANHGETDGINTAAKEVFRGHLIEWITWLRYQMGWTTVPFLMTQVRPDLITNEARFRNLDDAVKEITRRVPFTAQALSPVGTQFYRTADSVHFNAAGVREIGHRLYTALTTARANDLRIPIDVPGLPTTGQTMPALPAGVPVVKWSAIRPAGAGDSIDQLDNAIRAAGHAGTGAVVEFDNGMDLTHRDFLQAAWAQGGYSVFAPLCRGMIARGGPDQVRISLAPGSSTSGAKIPTQSSGSTTQLTCFRIGPSRGANVVVFGLTFAGSEQGHIYNGFANYAPGAGTVFQWLRFQGYSEGNWNSPPGETNIFQTYTGDNAPMTSAPVTLLKDIDASGLRPDGTRSGSAFSTTGAGRIRYENVNIHDMEVSGFTFGTAGSVTTGTLTRNAQTVDVVINNNANHRLDGGQKFGGMNHEGVDNVEHIRPKIWIPGNSTLVNKEHFAINNSQKSSRVYIEDPYWFGEKGGSGSFANRCLAISVDSTYINQAQSWADIQVVLTSKHPLGPTSGTRVLTPIPRAQAASAQPHLNYIRLDTSV